MSQGFRCTIVAWMIFRSPMVCCDMHMEPGDVPRYANTVFVHAGLHKTGTSYIQQSLYTHRNLLLPRLSYDPLPWVAHHFLTTNRNMDPDIRNNSEASNARRDFLARLKANDKLAHLISSEGIGIASNEILNKLSAALRPHKIHAVLFYRNLLEYTKSMYTQVAHLREYRSSFGDFYFDQAFGKGDSFRTWILSTISRIQTHLSSRLSIIDYEGAKAAGDIADALLDLCGLGSHFLRKAAVKKQQGHRTSVSDEPVRELLDIFQMYAYAKHNCSLKWDNMVLHKQNLSATLLIGSHMATSWVLCADLGALRETAHAFDKELRHAYNKQFVAKFSNPEANRLAIDRSSAVLCGLNRGKVLSNIASWAPLFDRQLRDLPSWMSCKNSWPMGVA